MLSIKRPNELKTVALSITVSIAVSLVFCYAVVGFVTLHLVKPSNFTTGTCDMITEEDSILWCKVVMSNEDEAITVLKKEIN